LHLGAAAAAPTPTRDAAPVDKKEHAVADRPSMMHYFLQAALAAAAATVLAGWWLWSLK
jgi:hypothetical protein